MLEKDIVIIYIKKNYKRHFHVMQKRTKDCKKRKCKKLLKNFRINLRRIFKRKIKSLKIQDLNQ